MDLANHQRYGVDPGMDTQVQLITTGATLVLIRQVVDTLAGNLMCPPTRSTTRPVHSARVWASRVSSELVDAFAQRKRSGRRPARDTPRLLDKATIQRVSDAATI